GGADVAGVGDADVAAVPAAAAGRRQGRAGADRRLADAVVHVARDAAASADALREDPERAVSGRRETARAGERGRVDRPVRDGHGDGPAVPARAAAPAERDRAGGGGGPAHTAAGDPAAAADALRDDRRGAVPLG